MAEDYVPLLNLNHSDTDIISVTLENRNTYEQSVLYPNVIVFNLDEKNKTDGILVDDNIKQEESIVISKFQGILWALKERRPEILEKGPALPEGKEAHIFVSYSSNDTALVFPIIAELELKHSLACILDERDFQFGNNVLGNINTSIDISVKVLIFLSKNFNQSGYCKHENDLALIASLENGENMIIPVLLEECGVPRSLRTLTYIDAIKHKTRQTICQEIYQAFSLQERSEKCLTSFGKTDQGDNAPVDCVYCNTLHFNSFTYYTGSEKCPVLSFEKYISKLNPDCYRLWQKPKDSFLSSDAIWFCNVPVGEKKLKGFMSTLSTLSGLSKSYTNHSIRATGATLLSKNMFGPAQVMAVTGHKSVQSLTVYQRVNDHEKVQMGQALSENLVPTETNQVVPYLGPALSTPSMTSNVPLQDISNQLAGINPDELFNDFEMPSTGNQLQSARNNPSQNPVFHNCSVTWINSITINK